MKTQCKSEKLNFQALGRRRVEGAFDGGTLTSDGGGLLLREVENRFGVVSRLAGCFEDLRDPRFVEHSVQELVAQRVFGLALGYEDLNDHDELRLDPLMAVLAGKRDPLGEDRQQGRDLGKACAGKSTLNRLELSAAHTSAEKKIPVRAEAVEDFFLELFIATQEKEPEEIVLDVDATDDPLHGRQEGRFFHGYYKSYCYLPLYVFCGEDLLSARLRPSDIDAAAGTVEELERIAGRLRGAWPQVRILVRGDSGFAREEILRWCEQNKVDYVIGLARNERLQERIAGELAEARRQRDERGQASRVYADFSWRTRQSWSRSRRVVAKAEWTLQGPNPRFVVTSLKPGESPAAALYEKIYCARGEMENRIKEQQLGLFADRTSTSRMKSNQLRLWFSSAAYCLLRLLRKFGLQGTQLARATCQTIRLKLLKIGAQVQVSVRRVAVALASGCPYEEIFRQALRQLKG